MQVPNEALVQAQAAVARALNPNRNLNNPLHCQGDYARRADGQGALQAPAHCQVLLLSIFGAVPIANAACPAPVNLDT